MQDQIQYYSAPSMATDMSESKHFLHFIGT